MRAGKSRSGSRSWLLVAARRWFSAEPVMTIFMQGDLSRENTYHVHGRNSNSSVAGKPDALKGARPVWRGAHGTGPFPNGTSPGAYPTRTCTPAKPSDSITTRSAATWVGI